MSLTSNLNALSRFAALGPIGTQFLRLPTHLLGFAALYFLAAKIGIATQLPPEGIVIIWPPNAIVLVTLLSVARDKWWVFFIATVATEIAADMPDYPLWAAAGYGAVNFAEATTAAVLVTAFNKGSSRLVSLADFVGFLVSGPIVASASAALLGAAIYKLGSPDLDYFYYWRVFWFGDALGLLIVGTVLLSWRKPYLWGNRAGRHIEAIGLAIGWTAAAYWIFFNQPDATRVYLIFPFLMWAALRFGVRGASAAVSGTVVAAIWSAVTIGGSFAALSNIQSVVPLQGLILVIAISTFMLAFSVEDSLQTATELAEEVEHRKTAENDVRQTNQKLDEVNRYLDHAIADRTLELTKSLDRNKLLLNELKHRVKNNLQVVSSLVGFHRRDLHDESAREKLGKLQMQIGAIASTYDVLHQSESTETLDFCSLVPILCKNVAGSHGDLVCLSVETSGYFPVSPDTAVALSLTLNELITNSIKHGIGKANVTVTCRREVQQVLLKIVDDGPGFPPGFDINEATGFGLTMARSLIAQAYGSWHFVPAERGAAIEINLPIQ